MNNPVTPAHYQDGGVETIEYLQAKLSPEEFRGYIKGNVLKYLSRERGKGGNTDLRKAAWYLLYYLGGADCCARFVDTALAGATRKIRKSRRPRNKRYNPKT